MAKVEILFDYCKACGLCISACKNNVLKLGNSTNSMGYNVVTTDESMRCIGCKMCAIVCPEAAIEVYR